VPGLEAVQPQDADDGDDERAADGGGPDDGARPRRAVADDRVPEEPERRQEDHPPEQRVGHHHRSIVTSSTLTVDRERKTCRMIARPTAASAAATAITKNTITCPSTACWLRANVTNVRFTAFSMSSIAMKMTIRFR